MNIRNEICFFIRQNSTTNSTTNYPINKQSHITQRSGYNKQFTNHSKLKRAQVRKKHIWCIKKH